MKIDKNKLARQEEIISKWKANKAKGTLEACTGFGKTFVGALVIQEMNQKNPERSTIVVVPSSYLKKQWEDKVKEFKLLNVEVIIVNTAIKRQLTCDLMVLDEIHNYAAASFKKVFRTVTYKFILGLTATMERLDGREILIRSKCPVIDTVTLEEALDKGYVSDFRVFNLGIELDDVDRATYKKIGDNFYKYFSMFGHDFDTAMRCLSDPAFRTLYAERMGWTPEETMMFAVQFQRNMSERKKFLYYASSKVDMAVKLIKTFEVPTITFSQSTEFCDIIEKREPKLCVTYHSKMKAKEKKAALAKFKDGRSKTRVINTAKSLDEGFDIPSIVMAIICSGTSSFKQDLQRTGRAIRMAEGKLGLIVNLYIKNTQDEKWLRARQIKTTNVVHVNSVEEIERIVTNLKMTA